MSITALTSLRDYLFSALTPSNLIWLGEQLTDYGNKHQEEALKPYSMEEIYRMLNESELQIKNGDTLTDDEVWKKYENKM